MFPACAVTRAQSRKFGDVLDLSKLFVCSEDVLKNAEKRETSMEKCQISVFDNLLPADANRCFSVNRTEFIKAKQADPSLAD